MSTFETILYTISIFIDLAYLWAILWIAQQLLDLIKIFTNIN